MFIKNCAKANLLYEDAYKELLTVVALIMSFVIDIPLLTLASFGVACLLVVFSEHKKSIYYLAFFTSFAGIFVYNGRHLFFVMVGLFIAKSFFESKVNKITLLYYLIIVLYSILFCDVQGSFSFAKLIGLILLFAIP